MVLQCIHHVKEVIFPCVRDEHSRRSVHCGVLQRQRVGWATKAQHPAQAKEPTRERQSSANKNATHEQKNLSPSSDRNEQQRYREQQYQKTQEREKTRARAATEIDNSENTSANIKKSKREKTLARAASEMNNSDDGGLNKESQRRRLEIAVAPRRPPGQPAILLPEDGAAEPTLADQGAINPCSSADMEPPRFPHHRKPPYV